MHNLPIPEQKMGIVIVVGRRMYDQLIVGYLKRDDLTGLVSAWFRFYLLDVVLVKPIINRFET